MDEELYRHDLRNHFMGQVKNSKLQKYCSNSFAENAAQQLKEQTQRAKQKIQEFEITSKPKHYTIHRSSGGDADRTLYDAASSSDVYGQKVSDNSYTLKHLHCNSKAPVLPQCVNTNMTTKFNHDECADRLLFENDSNLEGLCAASEGSGKSQKSSKTVISRRSSHELRHIVKSKCKLHEMIDETLKQMCQTNLDNDDYNSHKPLNHLNEPEMIANAPELVGPCKHCKDKVHQQNCLLKQQIQQNRQSQKDVTTEIRKGDFLDYRNNDTLTISVDDVVNSKVINPMIRKLQRMYINNLREEMSLMEDLERLPHRVNEVYKATIFKQKD